MTDRNLGPIELLIVDMDNTLYDWVGFFVPAVEAMLGVAVGILHVSESDLRNELREVHVLRGNTEHPFALLETKSVRCQFAEATRAERFRLLRPAFDAFDAERRVRLKLYPDVLQTLEFVRSRGCRIVGHTEATEVNIRSRIRALGLVDLVEVVYAPVFDGLGHPLGRSGKSDSVASVQTRRVTARKPEPETVRQILADLRTAPKEALYVGDSLRNDIGMAKDAGIWAAWARYGAQHDAALWPRLVALSHWRPSAAVAEQVQNSSPLSPGPDVILDSFGELVELFSFRRPAG